MLFITLSGQFYIQLKKNKNLAYHKETAVKTCSGSYMFRKLKKQKQVA